MKSRFVWASALALAVSLTSQIKAATNGVIVISTRAATDALWRQISSSGLYDADDNRGPGTASPGDAAMSSLLGDYGYVVRMVPDRLLRPDANDPYGTYTDLGVGRFYGGGGGPTASAPANSNALFQALLLIVSGSSSSADVPYFDDSNTNVPVVCGEHSCLGDNLADRNMYMYGNYAAPNSHNNQPGNTPGAIQYMIVNTNAPIHPILQGIPLDSQNRVKIWRDAYPEEDAVHTPPGAKLNYRYTWQWVDTNAGVTLAPATQVLGWEGDNANRVVFAVNPAGGQLSNGGVDHANYVHIFVNEHGSGDARRGFNALTDIAKIIFIRACKWAMGETLTPYQPLGLIKISKLSPTQIQIEWTGTADKNYKILGTQNLLGPANFSNWQPVAEDIHGVNGTVTAKFDISNAKQYAFLRVMPVP